MATATFTVTIPEATAWDTISALAEAYGYPGDSTDQSKAATITAFLRERIASDLAARAAQVLTVRAQNAALAAVTAATPPTITITAGQTAPATPPATPPS